MRNRNRHSLSSQEHISDTSYDPNLYPLASLSLAFSHSILAPTLRCPELPLPSTVRPSANGVLHGADEVLPRGTSPSSDWTRHTGSGDSEWTGRASNGPHSDAEVEMLRFEPNRMVDYTGASTTAMAAGTSMKWGVNLGGRSVRSMIRDALKRHSRIVPLGDFMVLRTTGA